MSCNIIMSHGKHPKINIVNKHTAPQFNSLARTRRHTGGVCVCIYVCLCPCIILWNACCGFNVSARPVLQNSFPMLISHEDGTRIQTWGGCSFSGGQSRREKYTHADTAGRHVCATWNRNKRGMFRRQRSVALPPNFRPTFYTRNSLH